MITRLAFARLVRESPTFDDFLQNVANYSIERFIGHTYYPPKDRPHDTLLDTIELLLNAMIASDFEQKYWAHTKKVYG